MQQPGNRLQAQLTPPTSVHTTGGQFIQRKSRQLAWVVFRRIGNTILGCSARKARQPYATRVLSVLLFSAAFLSDFWAKPPGVGRRRAAPPQPRLHCAG